MGASPFDEGLGRAGVERAAAAALKNGNEGTMARSLTEQSRGLAEEPLKVVVTGGAHGWEYTADSNAPQKLAVASRPEDSWGMETEKRVVWILGAGFSVPLGGPLFRELISTKTLSQFASWGELASHKIRIDVPGHPAATHPSKEFEVVGLAGLVLNVYTSGADERRRLWTDAEEFLDTLEIACTEGDPTLTAEFNGLLQRALHSPVSEVIRVFRAKDGLKLLHREAVRFVAAACTTFLRRFENNPALVRESELWAPYRRWIEKLKSNDSIVSFNYDRALDLLNEYLVSAKQGQPGNRLVLDSPIGNDPAKFASQRAGIVPVYNLHGHVGWLATASGGVDCGAPAQTGIRPCLARAHFDPDDAVLGIPGRIKTGMPTGVLKDVWNRAMADIANATSVVFVGYRFPETDNVAKQRLADALRNNPKALVHVVLGAGSPDMPRLKGMIEWTRDAGANPVRVHQMKCQDFFAVFERDKL